MPFPIFTLQDVDPRFNETAVSNDQEVMQQAQQIKDDKKNIKNKLIEDSLMALVLLVQL